MDTRRRHLLFSAIAALALSACRNKPRLSALPPGSQVLAFGDSVTYGTGAGPGEDWPTQLMGLTGWKITNHGIPGDTAAAAKSRIKASLEATTPQLVLIEIGGNDFLRRRPDQQVKEDIRYLIQANKDAGAAVVLVGVPELSLMAALAGKPSDSPIYAQLSEEEKVALVPNVFSGILADPTLCADKIHPNAAGYRAFAQGVFERLRELGLVAR